MQSIDTALIKMNTSHYWIKRDNIVSKIEYKGRTFFNKFELINEPLSYQVMKDHDEGFINFTAYESKTPGHLHLYVHKGHTTLNEGYQIANKLSMLLSSRLVKEWRVFPTMELPKEFNILALPYKVYQKERGASWSKHM